MLKIAKYVRNCVVFWKKLHNWHLFSSWSSICNCLANTHMHPWDQLSNSHADRTITQFFSQKWTEIICRCTSGFLQRLGMVVWPGAVNISERRSKSRIRSDDRSQPRIATGQLPSAISFLSQSTLSSQSHPVSPLVLLCLSQRERPPSATALPAYYTFCPNSHSTRRCACRTSDITITLSSIPGIRNLL